MVWERMNQFYFAGELAMPRFELRRMKSSWAKFRSGEHPVIVISREFFEQEPKHTLAELVATLGHEQIHMLQWQQGRELRHDEFFKKHAERLGYE